MIEQVLINLVLDVMEAVEDQSSPAITVGECF
jgi:C4-dicarboxylate-specific signal transduction histidine kinase